MIVVVCRMALLASHCHSLKQKRNVIRKLKERVRNRMRVSIAEVGGQGTWQRMQLGFAVVGSDREQGVTLVREVVDFVESTGLALLLDYEYEVLTYGGERLGQVTTMAEWEQSVSQHGSVGNER